jgi:hypothetical protein
MNAFWASENLLAFMVLRSSPVTAQRMRPLGAKETQVTTAVAIDPRPLTLGGERAPRVVVPQRASSVHRMRVW